MKPLQSLIKQYQKDPITIGVLGSHSALEICWGAKKQGFRTLVVAQKGRDQTYSRYYKKKGKVGCVDECLTLPRFADILQPQTQQELIRQRVIFVPHRSFEAYLHSDYEAIENDFRVPLFGNRYLLKFEERGFEKDQYWLMRQAGIRYPKIFANPKTIDRLCLVKVLEKDRGFERAFFLVKTYADYQKQVAVRLGKKQITRQLLRHQAIEEFVLGVQVNFNFFYSPPEERLELLGTDTRRQTNLEGILKTPAQYQQSILKQMAIRYEEAGHIATTVLESLLEPAFELGERFVAVTQKLIPPGVIGPFALQTIITPGPPKKEIVVVDISPRMPGSPGITATPYSSYLFGKPMSMGERIAWEIGQAHQSRRLAQILT